MRRSVTTRSYRRSSARRSPSAPSTALSTSCPSRFSTSARTARRLSASSTTRMRWRAISGAGVDDGPGDQARALVAALGGLEAEGQADESLAAPVGEERRPRGVLHARLDRSVVELAGVGAGGELDPDEEAALRLADLDVGVLQDLPEPAQHRVPLGAVHVDQPGHVGSEVVAQEVGGHARGEGIDAAAEEEPLEGGDHLLGRAEPAEPEARPEDLRHGARAHHPAPTVERVERREMLALEAQLPVAVVLEDQGVVLLARADHPPPPPPRHL